MIAAPAGAAAPDPVDSNAASGVQDADGAKMSSHPVGDSHDCITYYPSMSRTEMESTTGAVLVRYDVTETGAIANVVLEQSSGSDRLDNAVLSCILERWHNTPAMVDGKPVASPGHQARIVFTRPH